MSWPPCATPRSMSVDSPDTPTSPPPNATTAGHPTPPSTPSSPHDQLDRRRSAPFHDLAMPLGRRDVPSQMSTTEVLPCPILSPTPPCSPHPMRPCCSCRACWPPNDAVAAHAEADTRWAAAYVFTTLSLMQSGPALLDDARLQFVNRQPGTASVDHPVTVRTTERKVGEQGPCTTADVQRRPMMNLDVLPAPLAVGAFKIERAHLAGHLAAGGEDR